MRRLLPLPLIAFLLALTPTADAATCRVSNALYETPEVQVYKHKHTYFACVRATGKRRTVGGAFNDTLGTTEDYSVHGLLGGRWLYQQQYATYSESFDYRNDQLLDLRTGKVVEALVSGDEETNEVIGLPGALVQAGAKGVLVRFADGRRQRLDSERAEAPASSGARVYWRTAAGPRSALVALPAPAPARALPRAHRTARCTPKAGAKLLVSDGTVVVTRVGDTTFACRRGRTRAVGAVSDFRIVSDRDVAYTRPGFTGLLNVVTGERRELAGPGATNGWMLVAGGADGLRVWPDAAPLADGPVSDVAVSVDNVVYWLDAAGAVHSR
jgi:hypothetical protein